jgi:hypothetical protein
LGLTTEKNKPPQMEEPSRTKGDPDYMQTFHKFQLPRMEESHETSHNLSVIIIAQEATFSKIISMLIC